MKHSRAASDNFLYYILTGDEFARKIKIESLLHSLLTEESRTTNLYRYHADDFEWLTVISQARTVSLMGGAQVFWISEIDEIKAEEWENFALYFEHPVQESRFIFEGSELSRDHLLFKLTQKNGTHLHFSQSRPQLGYDFLRDKIRRANKRMSAQAWHLLEERSGGSSRLMDLCLDQLILYTEGDWIAEDDVQKISAEVLTYDPFDLTKALARRDIPRALKIFHYFYELDGEMTGLVGLIHWQLRRIWQAKQLLKHGNPPEEIDRTLRISSGRLSEFLGQVNQFDESALESLVHKLWQVDRKSKNSGKQSVVAMEKFLASV